MGSCSSEGYHPGGGECAGHDSWLGVDTVGSGVFGDRCALDDEDTSRTGRRSPVERRPVHGGACAHVGPAVADGSTSKDALAMVPTKEEGGGYSGGNINWSFVSFPCGVIYNETVEK